MARAGTFVCTSQHPPASRQAPEGGGMQGGVKVVGLLFPLDHEELTSFFGLSHQQKIWMPHQSTSEPAQFSFSRLFFFYLKLF